MVNDYSNEKLIQRKVPISTNISPKESAYSKFFSSPRL